MKMNTKIFAGGALALACAYSLGVVSGRQGSLFDGVAERVTAAKGAEPAGVSTSERLPATVPFREHTQPDAGNVAALDQGQDLVLPINAQAPEMDDKPVSLAAESMFGKDANETPKADPGNPSSLPLQRRSLDNYKDLDEGSLREMHGMKSGKRYTQSLVQLKGHLVGTQKEKFNAVKDCERRFDGKDLGMPPSEDNLGCTYWRILQLTKAEATGKVVKKKVGKKGVSGALAKLKRSRVRTENDWHRLAGASYYEAMAVLDFRSLLEARHSVEFALKGPEDCALVNARAAIVRNLEDFLPDKEAFELMSRVTGTLSGCLKPTEEAYEIVHVRMGLLFLERSRFNEAATHLELALQTESPTEEYRSLFWRGFVEALQHVEGGKIKEHENTYWRKLIAEYPLTLHALVADELQGREPYARIAGRPSPQVAMYAGNKWDRYNLASFVTGLLIARQEKVALERWSRYLSDNVRPVDFESGLFQALAHLRAGNTRAGILTVFGVLKDFGGDKLNPKVLELLYPLRYHQEVVKHSRGVDAALVMSLIRQESSFNPRATSPMGARGLMQVMPATARKLLRGQPMNLQDPVQNITVGTRYLGKLLAAHDDNYVFTFASYNAGPRPVNKWRTRYDDSIPLLFSDLIPYPETRNYVSGLLRNMHWYRSLLNNVAHDKEDGGHLPWTAAQVAPRPMMFGLDEKAPPVRLAIETRLLEKAAGGDDDTVTE